MNWNDFTDEQKLNIKASGMILSMLVSIGALFSISFIAGVIGIFVFFLGMVFERFGDQIRAARKS